MPNYTQLSLKERRRLHAFLDINYPVSKIAIILGRHRSTIYREINRNMNNAKYNSYQANKLALERKQRKGYIMSNRTLRQYITKHLKDGWSPEQIVGRLKRKKSKYIVCHETIYRYIYKHNYNLHHYLPYRRSKRCKFRRHAKSSCRFGDIHLITRRPDYIETRERFGHWEGDAIEFKGNKKKAIITLLERKTRRVLLIKVEAKNTDTVMHAIVSKLKKYPPGTCKSITFDQGGEFARGGILKSEIKCNVYYCHPHSPCEKGSNENMNGRLRRWLPKSANIDEITHQQLEHIESLVNNTPRKCIDYRTPKEEFAKQQAQIMEYRNRIRCSLN